MYACVKYSRSCAGHSDVAVINTSDIISNFDATCFDRSKLFNIDCEKGASKKCSAFVLFVTKTRKEAVHRMATERHKYPPLNKATSATSGSEAENLNLNSSVLQKKATKRVYQPASTELSSMIESKITKIQKRNAKIDEALFLSSEESTSSDVELMPPQKVDKVQKGEKKGGSHFKKPVPANNVQEQTKKNSTNKKLDSESESEEVNIGSMDDLAFFRNLLKEKNKEIAKKDSKIAKLQAEILECNRRNSGLQDKLLLRLDAIDKNIEDIEKDAANKLGKETFDKVGALKENKIHIGQNIWIERDKYDCVLVVAKSPQTFINHLAESTFGLKVLLNSSVTGSCSNRIKKSNPTARPRLDGKIVCAIQDCFEHWARHCTPPYDPVQINYFRNEVPSVISKHITKLRSKHCKKKHYITSKQSERR